MTEPGREGRRRWAATGGIAGPVAFATAWASLAATRPGYSNVTDAISRLAAVDAPTRPGMTTGMVALGVGLSAYAVALRTEVPGPAWRSALVSGLAALGVAALPLDVSPAMDTAHGIAATIGYASLAATPALAARHLSPRWATASRAVALACGASLVATAVGPWHGLFQRTGLTIGHAWVAATAVGLLRRRETRR